jgi:PPM family protein phosphatase
VFFKIFFSKSSKFRTEILSVTGRRNQNEDNCLALKLDKGVYFLAVADGMGGIAGGQIASKIVLSAIEEYLKHDLQRSENPDNLKDVLSKAFVIGQTTVADHIKSHPEFKGMGTTLTAVLIRDGKYAWANLGDSRIYLRSDGQLKLITEDHSYIHDYFKNFNKELPETIISQYKNIVTKVIDGNLDKPDIYPEKGDSEYLKEGDLFLLCSDGLIIDKVKDYSGFFINFLNRKKSLKTIARKMVDWALDNGSDDNISVVLAMPGFFYNGEVENSLAIEQEDDMQTVRILTAQESKGD